MAVFPVPKGWTVQAALRADGRFEDVRVLRVYTERPDERFPGEPKRWVVCSPAFTPDGCAEVYTVAEEEVRMVKGREGAVRE
jgi:hypothetical protein